MSTYRQGYIDSQLGVRISLGELGDIRSSSFTAINGKIIFAYIDNDFILRVVTNENTSYTEIYDSGPDLYSSVIVNQQGTALIAHRDVSDIISYTTTRLENASQENNRLNTSYNNISSILGEQYIVNTYYPNIAGDTKWSLFNSMNTSIEVRSIENTSAITQLGKSSDDNTSGTLWGNYNYMIDWLGNEDDTGVDETIWGEYNTSIYYSIGNSLIGFYEHNDSLVDLNNNKVFAQDNLNIELDSVARLIPYKIQWAISEKNRILADVFSFYLRDLLNGIINNWQSLNTALWGDHVKDDAIDGKGQNYYSGLSHVDNPSENYVLNQADNEISAMKARLISIGYPNDSPDYNSGTLWGNYRAYEIAYVATRTQHEANQSTYFTTQRGLTSINSAIENIANANTSILNTSNFIADTPAILYKYNTSRLEYGQDVLIYEDALTKLSEHIIVARTNISNASTILNRNMSSETRYFTIENDSINSSVVLKYTPVDMISMSYDGKTILSYDRVTNTVYLRRIMSTIEDSVIWIFDGAAITKNWYRWDGITQPDMSGTNNVTSISVSGDGRIIAIGFEETSDIPSYLVGCGMVETFVIHCDTIEHTGYIYGELGSELLGKSVSLNKDGTKIAVGLPGYHNISTYINANISSETKRIGAVKIYNYDGEWIEHEFIANDDEYDLTGTFGTNVVLSPDGNNVIISDTTSGICYKNDNQSINCIPISDINYKGYYGGNNPLYITDDDIVIIEDTNISRYWTSHHIDNSSTMNVSINFSKGTKDRFYITSISNDGKKLAVAQNLYLESGPLVMVYTFDVDTWIYHNEVPINLVTNHNVPVVLENVSGMMNAIKLSGDGNTIVYSFKDTIDNMGYIYVFKEDQSSEWEVKSVLMKNIESNPNYLSSLSITNDGKIIAVSSDDDPGKIDIFLLNDDGEHINDGIGGNDNVSGTSNIIIENVSNGAYALAINGDATLESEWVTIAASSVTSNTTNLVNIYNIPEIVMLKARIESLTYSQYNTSLTDAIITDIINTSDNVSLVSETINSHIISTGIIDNTKLGGAGYTVDISDDGNIIAVGQVISTPYTAVISRSTLDSQNVSYDIKPIDYTGIDTNTSFGSHLTLSGDSSTIAVSTGYDTTNASPTNPYVIVYKYLDSSWKRIDRNDTYNISYNMFDSTPENVSNGSDDSLGKSTFNSISKDGNTIAAGIYHTDTPGENTIAPFIVVYTLRGDIHLEDIDTTETLRLVRNISSTSDVIDTSKHITSLTMSTDSSSVLISNIRNVHLYNKTNSKYVHVYDLLKNGKIYNDIFNISVNSSGNYVVVEHSIYISIFSITNMKLVLLEKIKNLSPISRFIHWTYQYIVITTQHNIIRYDLSSKSYVTYDNSTYTFCRFIQNDPQYVFRYSADADTLDRYDYDSNTTTTIITLSDVAHEVGDIQILHVTQSTFILIGIPDLMKVKIIKYDDSPINLNGVLYIDPPLSLYIDSPLSFYTGFGKQIDIDITDYIISISCDNYVHIYKVLSWGDLVVTTSRYITIDPSYDEINIPSGLNDITFSDDDGTEIKSFKYIQ